MNPVWYTLFQLMKSCQAHQTREIAPMMCQNDSHNQHDEPADV